MDGEMPDLWPPGTLERINDVTHFVYGHLVTQQQIDLAQDRELAQWIALISGHVGRAAELVARAPDDADALELWDHVIGLASFPGFAEMKRSLRERPQLRAFGVEPGTEGLTEDWHQGSRRQKR